MIDVNGRLHSTEKNVNVIAGADEILDDSKNKKQNEINTETYSLVNDINERLSGLSPDQQSALSVAAKATNNEIKLGYYVCGTEGNIAAKVISDATGYTLSTGGSIKVKMTNANTADNATLNINSTGAKPLFYDGERASANNTWEAGETVEVYYDGTNFYANNVAGGGGDGVFDVSEKYPTSGVEGGNTYTLEGALTVLNANLPASKKKGGMSFKFVHTDDNKYIQYRYTATSTGTNIFNNEANWELDITKKNLSDDFLGILSEIKDFRVEDYILLESGKFNETPTFKHAIIPVNEGEIYYLIGDTNSCRYAFATSDTSISGGDIPLVAGTSVIVMPAIRQYYKVLIPSGCNYLLFNAKGNYGTRCYRHYDTLKEGTDKYTDNEAIDESKNLINSGGVYKLKSAVQSITGGIVDLSKYYVNQKAYIDGTKWLVTNGYTGNLITVTPNSKISITAKSNQNAKYSFVTNNVVVNNTNVSFATGYSSAIIINAGESATDITVPSDAAYMWIQRKFDNVDRTPTEIAIIGELPLVKTGLNQLKTYTESKVNQIEPKVNSLNDGLYNALPLYKGLLDSSNKIVAYNQSKYKVVEVNGGELFELESESNIPIFILSSFTYNPTLPYTPTFATGESGRRYYNHHHLYLPNDARYVLVSAVTSAGVVQTFTKFAIDGIDMIHSIEDFANSKSPSERVDNVENVLSRHFGNYIPTLVWVQGGIGIDGSQIAQGGTWEQSSPFFVKKGATVTYNHSSNHSGGVSALAIKDGNSYTAIMQLIPDKTEYTYTATEDVYIVATGKYGESKSVVVSTAPIDLGFIHPWYGKTLVTLCDSMGDSSQWQEYLAELTGAVYSKSRNDGKYSKGGTRTLDALSSQDGQSRAKRLVTEGYITPDIIIYENVNDNGMSVLGDNNDEPFFRSVQTRIELDNPPTSAADAETYWQNNIATIVADETPQAGTILGIPFTANVGGKLTINSGSTADGIIIIQVGAYQLKVTISANMTKAEIVNEILRYNMTYSYHYQDPNDEYSIIFANNNGQALSSFAADGGTTGVSITATNGVSANNYVWKYFYGHDLSKWSDITYWKDNISKWSAWKGLIEYLQTTFPSAIIYWMMPRTYNFNYNNPPSAALFPDGTINYTYLYKNQDLYNSAADAPILIQERAFCQFYQIPVLDMIGNSGINPMNASQFCKVGDVHPKQAAYDRWAETIARLTV